MSASLVGSEMCIRDSCAPLCLSTGRRQRRTRDDPSAGARPGRVHHTQPVSYTHLTLPTICSV
eukprot:502525-Alexandrium_andersonii.AAC.1